MTYYKTLLIYHVHKNYTKIPKATDEGACDIALYDKDMHIQPGVSIKQVVRHPPHGIRYG